MLFNSQYQVVSELNLVTFQTSSATRDMMLIQQNKF